MSAARRRIYLMRHGSVDYFGPDGEPLGSEDVPLNASGRVQAEAAGLAFARQGVRFDLAVCSGLPRTMETASRVLAAGGQPDLAIEADAALAELRPGVLDDIAEDELEAAFTRPFTATGNVENLRFMGGETIGDLLDRVLPAFSALLAREDWDCLLLVLLVLHGGVNRALLSLALSGGRSFFGRFEQAPACVNILDVGTRDMIVRATNLAPTQWLHGHGRETSMEKLLGQYAPRRAVS